MLENLDLKTNNLQSFRTNLTSIAQLYLSFNSMGILNYSIIEKDALNSNLSMIYLSSCKIQFIESYFFKNLSKLNTIYIEKNLFNFLNESVLSGLSQLKTVKLSSTVQNIQNLRAIYPNISFIL